MRIFSSMQRLFRSALVFFLLLPFSANSQSDSAQTPHALSAPVVIEDDTLFFIAANIGPFTANERVKAVSEKMEQRIHGGRQGRDSVGVLSMVGYSNLTIDTLVLMAVTDADAQIAGIPRPMLAHSYASLIQEKIFKYQKDYAYKQILIDAGIASGLLVICIFLFWLLAKSFPRLYNTLDRTVKTFAKPIAVRSYRLISPDIISEIVVTLTRGIRLTISLIILYYWIINTLLLFPWTRSWNVKPILKGLFLAGVFTAGAFALLKGIQRVSKNLNSQLSNWKGTLIQPIKLKNINILTEERIIEILSLTGRGLIFFLYILVGYVYVTLLFSLFSFTETWASALFRFITNPLVFAFSAFVGYLPNLFSLVIIAGITRYLLKFIHFLFREVEKGNVIFPKFHKDWAEPTYKITRFLIFAFAAVVMFPFLPGSNSPFFQGISVFIGILLSLGSSSAISNIVAGTVLTYMRSFKIGDRVKIADTMGDIIDKTLLVTRIRTIKNVDITIPNAMILGSHIINYSSSSLERGLILHTSVTIGYDAPWRQIHSLLLAAASATNKILKEPPPFVLQTSLDDFYVSYELNAFTDAPSIMAQIYSDLHQNIQDKFNEAGVEIMSPHYASVRDGNQTTVPEGYLSKSYQAPTFRVDTAKKKSD